MENLPKLVQEEDDKVGTNSKLVKEKHELMGEQARSFN
jgi:hypothetical protein